MNYDKARAHKTRLIPARVDVSTNRIGKLTMVNVRAHKTTLIPATVDVTTNRIGKLTLIRLGPIKLRYLCYS